jgi:hypothetical protein
MVLRKPMPISYLIVAANCPSGPQMSNSRSTDCIVLVFLAWQPPVGQGLLIHEVWFLDHTQRRITVGRTPLDEWSARRRDLYLTTHNAHNRQTDRHPCPRWDSNAQSQQARSHWDRRPFVLETWNAIFSHESQRAFY